MNKGLIVKILKNQFFVKVDNEVYTCSVLGKLRYLHITPVVGDYVEIDLKKKTIENILPRHNYIRRPPVSNITQAFVVTSFVVPDFDTNLLDKLLLELEFNNIKPIICLTKSDLLDDIHKYDSIIKYYKKYYTVVNNFELDKIKSMFKGETTVFIGQTGAGKSTLLNNLADLNLATGEVSDALGRGKHTTRHIEIFSLFDGMILDTPGFSALEFNNMTKEEIRNCFIDFKDYPCDYSDCTHTKEPECRIKKEVESGNILKSRYENYLKFIETGLSNQDKYKRNK